MYTIYIVLKTKWIKQILIRTKWAMKRWASSLSPYRKRNFASTLKPCNLKPFFSLTEKAWRHWAAALWLRWGCWRWRVTAKRRRRWRRGRRSSPWPPSPNLLPGRSCARKPSNSFVEVCSISFYCDFLKEVFVCFSCRNKFLGCSVRRQMLEKRGEGSGQKYSPWSQRVSDCRFHWEYVVFFFLGSKFTLFLLNCDEVSLIDSLILKVKIGLVECYCIFYMLHHRHLVIDDDFAIVSKCMVDCQAWGLPLRCLSEYAIE